MGADLGKAVSEQKRLRLAFERALVLYDQAATTLALNLESIRVGEALDDDARKKLAEDIRFHQRTILRVLDHEAQLFKRRLSAAVAGARLDLAAARREIAGRLDRLVAAGA